MSMTLKNLRGRVSRSIYPHAGEGEKTRAELEQLVAEIVEPQVPKDASSLAKLFYENPGLLSSEKVLEELQNNVRELLIASGCASYNDTIAEIDEAREEYEQGNSSRTKN